MKAGTYIQFTQEEQTRYQKSPYRRSGKNKVYSGRTGYSFHSYLVMFSLVYGWSHSWVTLGDFTLVGMLSFSMLGFIWYASYQMTTFVREAGGLLAALSLITTPHEVQDAPNAMTLEVQQGVIRFKNVSLAYQTGKPIFNQLNVNIPAGQKSRFGRFFRFWKIDFC